MQSLGVQICKPELNQKNEALSPKIENFSSKDTFKDLLHTETEKVRIEKSGSAEDSPKVEKSAEDKNVKSDKKVKAEKKENKAVSKEKNAAAGENDEISAEENLNVENDFTEDRIFSFFPENRMPQYAVVAGNEDFTETETIELNVSQINYLRSPDKSALNNDFDALIDNAEIYDSEFDSDLILNRAQNLSVEEPEQFLSNAAVLQQNQTAVAVENLEHAFGQNENFIQHEEKNKNLLEKDSLSFFNYTVSAPEDEKGVFTIVDERSLEEKLSVIEKNADFSGGRNNIDFTLNLNESVSQNILSSNSQTAASTGSNFEAMLSRQIQTNAPDFVKAGQLILKDNNTGIINMNLKPESLGNVKLTLQVSDKNITGQIIVHSKEALEAFRQNLDTLKQAFLDSGFEDATFNLNLAQNQSDGSFQNAKQDQVFQQFYSKKVYDDYSTANQDDITPVASSYAERGDYKVNVVA